MHYLKLKELAVKAGKIGDHIGVVNDQGIDLVMSVTDAVTSSHIVNVEDSTTLRDAIIDSLAKTLADVDAEIRALL